MVRLLPVMARTQGSPDVRIGLIDGPIATRHPDLRGVARHDVADTDATCRSESSVSCVHGTFVAGILFGRRGSEAPSICPGCTLLARPVFLEPASVEEGMPSTTPESLAAAIVECVDAGARIINLSLALARPSVAGQEVLQAALDVTLGRGVLVVAAAGNQGTLSSTVITRHPWVIPVVGCDAAGTPISHSNLGTSIGRRGVRAPGAGVRSLSPDGTTVVLEGTSIATAFVVGTAALLWSLFPQASAGQIRLATTGGLAAERRTVTPPLLDASSALAWLSRTERSIA